MPPLLDPCSRLLPLHADAHLGLVVFGRLAIFYYLTEFFKRLKRPLTSRPFDAFHLKGDVALFVYIRDDGVSHYAPLRTTCSTLPCSRMKRSGVASPLVMRPHRNCVYPCPIYKMARLRARGP